MLAQRKQEFRLDGVDERKGATSCREVAASCREGVTPWCQSRRWGSRAVVRPPGLRSWPLGRRSGCTSAEPYPPPKPSLIVTCEQSSGNLCRGWAVLAGQLASQAGLLQLAITFLKDHLFESLKLVGRGDVTNRGMQSNGVVAVDVRGDSASGLINGTRAGRPNALAFQTAVPAFELAVGLGIVGTGPNMGHAHDADELLEVPGNELGTIIGDDPWPDTGVLLQGLLHDHLDLLFLHGFPQFPVDNRAAVAVEDAGEVVERAVDVDVGNINVPVLMRPQRLHKSGSFLGGSHPLAVESTSGLENAVNTGGADRHDVVVEHHEGQSAVSFERIAVVELEDGLSLPSFQPVIPGDLAVVLIGLAIPVFPSVEFAGGQIEPSQNGLGRSFSPIGPVADVIDHLVASVMGNPTSVQSSPRSFFDLTFSSRSSAMTSFLVASLASSCWMR